MNSRRGWGGVLLTALLLAAAVFAAPAQARDRGPTLARSASAAISSARIFRAPHGVTHLAVHWRGARTARVRVALSRDGGHFTRARSVEVDDLFEARPGRETYGAIIVAHRVRAVRVLTDRPLRRLTVLWLDDRGGPVRSLARKASVDYPQPKVIPRVDWGANESYRFNSSGQEIWPPAFYPVQKLIVHHTATQNNDPDPAATIRSIYYYHAVTQGWGDIGYNFLVDEAGNVYEGRHTFDYPSGNSPTEENALGYGVTAAHAQGFNSGTVGIAILGTLTNQDATPASRSAINRLLAWESDHHGIDPQGSSLYTNPVNGTQATFPNIAGHRDVAATECPGGVFYSTLPTTRSEVAAMLAGTPPAPDFSLSASPATQSVVRGRAATYTVTVSPENGFTGSVSLSATGVPTGATATFSPNPATTSSGLAVQTSRSTPQGGYTLTITGTNGSISRSTTVGLRVKRK